MNNFSPYCSMTLLRFFCCIFCNWDQSFLWHCLSVFVVFVGATEISTTQTMVYPYNRCNCDNRCSETKVIGLKSNGVDDTKGTRQLLLEEDADMDGDRTICARNREMIDLTFPSLCHMMCVNSCSSFRLRKVTYDNRVVQVTAIFRES